MRDILIGLGYFLTTLGIAIYGICLILKPQRYSLFLSRPLFARHLAKSASDWTESDKHKLRNNGIVMLILGAFMFLMPLVVAVTSPENAINPAVTPQAPHSEQNRWGSYIMLLLFLCLGGSLAIRPLPVLNYFRQKQSRLVALSRRDSMGPRFVGLFMIFAALWGLYQVGRH